MKFYKNILSIITVVSLIGTPAYSATKLSQIASGGAVNPATDKMVAVRSGTTDVLVTPPNGVSITAATPDLVITPSPGVDTITIGSTMQINALGTTTPYTILSADIAKLVTDNKTTAVAISVPQAGATGFGAGVQWCQKNNGSGVVTITPTTSTINGLASISLVQGAFACPVSDGTNYTALTAFGIDSVIPAANGGTGLSSGTSGGIPYFNSSTTIASSAALTANLPVIGGGAGVAPTVGTKTGNTTKFATSTGTLTSGNCVSIDASGNLVDAGGACTTGGGGGTVASSTIGQIAVYTAATTVTGSATLTTTTVPTLAGNNAFTGNNTSTGKFNSTSSITAGVATLSVSGGAIATDVSLANTFRITPTHSTSTTMSAPTNPVNGQKINYVILQDGTGSALISWNSIFDFGTSGAPTLTTAINKHDIVGFQYDSTAVKWNYTGSQLGFAN